MRSTSSSTLCFNVQIHSWKFSFGCFSSLLSSGPFLCKGIFALTMDGPVCWLFTFSLGHRKLPIKRGDGGRHQLLGFFCRPRFLTWLLFLSGSIWTKKIRLENVLPSTNRGIFFLQCENSHYSKSKVVAGFVSFSYRHCENSWNIQSKHSEVK